MLLISSDVNRQPIGKRRLTKTMQKYCNAKNPAIKQKKMHANKNAC